MNTNARKEFFSFARDRKLRHIYLEAEDLLGNNQESLAEFIEDANTEKLEVTFLAGDPQWTLPEKHVNAVELAKVARKFIHALKAIGMPSPAIFQFDIEPYLLDQWELELEDTANHYLDLLPKLKAALGGEMKLQVAVPCWFQDIRIYRKEKVKSFTAWITEAVDKVVTMDNQNPASEILQPANCLEGQINPMLALYPSNEGYCVFSLDAWTKHMYLMAAKGRWASCRRPLRKSGKPMAGGHGAHRLRSKRIIYG